VSYEISVDWDAVRLALTIGITTLGVSLPFIFVYVLGSVHVPVGWVSAAMVIFFIIVTLTFLAVLASNPNGGRLVLIFVAWLSLMGCFSLSNEAMEERALAERGRTDDCQVEDQEKNVDTSFVYPHWSVQSTKYVYRLECLAGGPDRMVTTSPVAEKGAIVSVRWDPSGRISPRPAYEVTSPDNSFALALVAGYASAFLTGLDVMENVHRRNFRYRGRHRR
jgi:hypothetical protein